MKITRMSGVLEAGAMEDESIRAWADLFKVTALPIREVVAQVVREGAEVLTEEFYERMMQNPRSAGFLDQERVQKRLKASLRRWMTELFATLDDTAIGAAIQRQIEVGIVHARIRLPIDLIPAGIRVLKRGIRRRIDFAPLNGDERLAAMIYVSDLLHLADGLMNHAYLQDAQEVARNDEAFRQISQKHSSLEERSRQRAALAEWTETLLLSTWASTGTPALPRLRDSEFGIWVHHKGSIMFEGADDLRDVVDSIERMDGVFLPRLQAALAQREPAEAVVGTIKSQIDLIRYKLNDLFDHHLGQDDGLDLETRLPDRRYLPAVLSREMRTHQASSRPLCLALIEVDFPTLQETAMSGARSRLLQTAATTLSAHIRTIDHLFRYDDQRFLLIAIECPRSRTAEMVAGLTESLRHAVHAGNVQGSWTPVPMLVSAGVAEFDRHPDYQYFIQRVETALAEASGRHHRSRVAFA
ncbi:GGDEF domain-containing protein [Hydrogenophaga electricum]|uniref:Diguanylate cyclase DosC n=1 Tax=Hydrogenophaga electricum TaxID=1230953 RepID=A0ABQ6C1N8_9BURK|nr:protoglobin domain-containing protein [Hydrogenophaga electricum]GLS12914.1 diguanylate cyclase [Hydrogenophaga electricum]